MKISLLGTGCALAYGLALCANPAMAATSASHATVIGADRASAADLSAFKHIVVIFQENHSFDNLYGNWGPVGDEPTNGRANAKAANWTQVRQDNSTAFQCLSQLDVNLTSPTPLPTSCTDSTGANQFVSAFTNQPFAIEDHIAATDTTCPPPGVFAANGLAKGAGIAGGCTRDIVHRYYTEQYQIHGGKQDRYMIGSDASGLVMGYYDSTKLPIYAYLHAAGAPNYIVADNFFQGAFGGSFLNHQWLIAAAAPIWAGAANDGGPTDFHSVLDANGMATNTPLYASPQSADIKDKMVTASCHPAAGRPDTAKGVTCGDYAVNTTQPTYQPYSPGTADASRLPPLSNPTIGDRLTAQGVKWAWYSGGWSNAAGNVGEPGWTNGATSAQGCTDINALATSTYPNCPDKTFQFHHQPFNYFSAYAPGTKARKEHLRDEEEFMQRAHDGSLLAVSFVKALGIENEHPGYASEATGSSHLVDLITAVEDGPDADSTLIIITYDEFGGQWDHVSPPGKNSDTAGAHDKWGPGTRIPAVLISKAFNKSGVDHEEHDTTSIITSIETRFGLEPVAQRDAKVKDMFGKAFKKALK
jgi:acid phosphatase